MRKLIYVLFVLALSFSAFGVLAQDDGTLRIGYIPILVMEQNFVASDQGWYDELGDYEIEEIRFSSGPPMVQAFAAGELDFAYVGINPALVIVSRGIEAKVVAGNVINALTVIASDEFAEIYEANPGAEAFSIFEEQTGRKLRFATLPQGSTPDTVLRLWLTQLGLDPESAVEIIPLGVEQVSAALATSEVDASLIMEPVISQAQEQEWGYRPIVFGDEVLPNQPGAVLLVSQALIDENPELVQQLVEIHIRATIFANENKDEAARIASERIGEESLPYEIARVAVDSPTLNWIYSPYTILESTGVYNQFQVDIGVFDEPVGIEDLFDFSFYDNLIAENPEWSQETEAVAGENSEDNS